MSIKEKFVIRHVKSRSHEKWKLYFLCHIYSSNRLEKKYSFASLLSRNCIFFYIDCKSWWSKPLEGNLILKAKCVMNKVINNNSEIRLKKRGWRWKNKREKGNWNPRGYISLIKINSLVIQTILLIPDKCFSFKNISNIKMTWTIYILNTKAMRSDWWKEYPKGEET